MRIVDAQIHLWGSGLPSNMAHRQVTSFTTEEALGLMDEGGVDAAVIHPPGWDPNATEMAAAIPVTPLRPVVSAHELSTQRQLEPSRSLLRAFMNGPG